MYTRLNNKEFKRMQEEYKKVQYPCRHCGHKQVIPYHVEKTVCGWCGHYIFKTNQEEFKYRIKEYIK